MEFCPEVAVLQSAFQLVQNKAGKKLETASKTECTDYIHILKATLEEICQGLESDLDLQDQLLWQKNMHTLILYALVKKVYKPTEKREGIPVYSPLDVLVQVLPTFSCHLYFELVKDCSWEQLLVNNLPYLEPSVGLRLLEDLIQHCTQDPVSCGDGRVMNSLRDALMTTLLSVPFEIDSVLEKLLKPLSKPDKYIPLPKESPDDSDYDIGDAQETINESETVNDEEAGELQAVTDKLVNHDEQSSFTQEEVTDNEMKGDVQNMKMDNSGADSSYEISPQTNEQSTDMVESKDKISNANDLHMGDDRHFWSNFLHRNSPFLEELLIFIESQVDKSESIVDHLQCLAQLGLIGFIKIEEGTASPQNWWLLFNLFCQTDHFQVSSATESVSELSPVYIVNVPVADQMAAQITRDRWLNCVHKVLEKTSEIFQGLRHHSNSSLTKASEPLGDISEDHLNSEFTNSATSVVSGGNFDISGNVVHIVAGLCLRTDVLNRMIQGYLVELENVVTDDTSKILKKCRDMMVTLFQSKDLKENKKGNRGSEKVTSNPVEQDGFEIKKSDTRKLDDPAETELNSAIVSRDVLLDNIDDTIVNDGMGVKYGDSWRSDVTLEAMCWRIKYRLPYCQDCVEMLLDPQCSGFWLDERVYDTFSKDIQLLLSKRRVIRLSEILRTLEPTSKEVTLKAQQLTCRSFTGLSFLDQDTVAMEMYVKDETLRDYLGFEDVQIMTVFNKITALRDDQILSELLLLCLCDPREVVSTAVKMSVRNKEQARNLAQVLQFFPNICQTSHPTHHPDCSLLGHVIREFLLTTNLTDKEQTTFVVFQTTLLQVPLLSLGQKKQPLLSPLELMQLVIVPFIGVHCLHNDGPITCKFALTMLKTVLECGCNKHCDLTEFESMALVLCLTELLQDCVAVWDMEEEISGLMKITVKSIVHDCVKLLGKMVRDGVTVPTEKAIEWFTHCLTNFDLSVVMQLREILASLGLEQCIQDHQEAVKRLIIDQNSNIASILLIAGVQPTMVQLTTVHQTSEFISYDELIVAMIQVLPNLLSSEFENAVRFVISLIDQELLSVPYRIGNTLQIPLTDIKDFQSVVGVSQILRDVIITLGVISDRSDIFHHILQCYTASLKSITNTTNVSSVEVKMFILSQIFHHVCDIVQLLPQQTTEPVLVLLLHLLTSYTDILASSDSIMKRHKWRKRMADSITNDIQLSVDTLPKSLVEKEMLQKKIKNVS